MVVEWDCVHPKLRATVELEPYYIVLPPENTDSTACVGVPAACGFTTHCSRRYVPGSLFVDSLTLGHKAKTIAIASTVRKANAKSSLRCDGLLILMYVTSNEMHVTEIWNIIIY